jgi:hypothetical protein
MSYLSGGQGPPQVSWGCTFPELSNKDQHHLVSPLNAAPCVRFDCLKICNFCIVMQFSRTVAPETNKGLALIAFMEKDRYPVFDREPLV